MAAKKKAAKAQRAALKARYNPYVQQVIDDEDLRDSLVQAYESAREAYTRLSNGKSPAKQIFDDKKLQKSIREATGNLRDVAVTLRKAPQKQRSGGGFGRMLLVGIVGAGLAVRALHEGRPPGALRREPHSERPDVPVDGGGDHRRHAQHAGADAERALRDRRAGGLLLGELRLLERLLQRPCRPGELHGEHGQPDRDQHERRAGGDQHHDPREQHDGARDAEHDPVEDPALEVVRAPGLELGDELGPGPAVRFVHREECAKPYRSGGRVPLGWRE